MEENFKNLGLKKLMFLTILNLVMEYFLKFFTIL